MVSLSGRFSIRVKLTIVFIGFGLLLTGLIAFASYRILQARLLAELRDKLRVSSALAAYTIDIEVLKRLIGRLERDISFERMQEVHESADFLLILSRLEAIQAVQRDLILWTYIEVPTTNTHEALLIACTDMPDLTPENYTNKEHYHFSKVEDISSWPDLQEAFRERRQVVQKAPAYDAAYDKVIMSGTMPIFDRDGSLLAALMIDIEAGTVAVVVGDTLRFFLWAFLAVAALAALTAFWLGRRLVRPVIALNAAVTAFARISFTPGSRDEIRALTENFTAMRTAIEGSLDRLRLMNLVSRRLQSIHRTDELFRHLLCFLTADLGFSYDRAFLFLPGEDGRLVLRHSLVCGEHAGERPGLQAFLSDPEFSSLAAMAGRELPDRPPPCTDASVLAAVLREGDARILGKDDFAAADDALAECLFAGIPGSQCLAIPFTAGGRPGGVLLVDRSRRGGVIGGGEAGELSVMLNEFSVILGNLEIMENLERLVSERTMELEERIAETAAAHRLLEARNLVMEHELEMARRIQQQMMPGKSPVEGLSFRYQPMDKVGGDLYDFIRMRGDTRIGIFISDVSGHGIPAALVSSMLKSLLQNRTDGFASPARLLAGMNEALVHRTSGHFVTAFYGIYDRRTRELVFSNAGHNPPFVISEDAVVMLRPAMNGPPLALLDNEELGLIEKQYREERVILPARSKLLCYTDGLTEAVPLISTGRQDFESTRLLGSLRELRSADAAGFVEGLFASLIDFRGSDEFEDDVCVVCLETDES